MHSYTGALGYCFIWCTGAVCHWVTGAPGAPGYWFTWSTGARVHWVTASGSLLMHRVTDSPGTPVRLVVHQVTGSPGTLVHRVTASSGALGHWVTGSLEVASVTVMHCRAICVETRPILRDIIVDVPTLQCTVSALPTHHRPQGNLTGIPRSCSLAIAPRRMKTRGNTSYYNAL